MQAAQAGLGASLAAGQSVVCLWAALLCRLAALERGSRMRKLLELAAGGSAAGRLLRIEQRLRKRFESYYSTYVAAARAVVDATVLSYQELTRVAAFLWLPSIARLWEGNLSK